jgi:SOS-response transcriptional repressor LexA
VTLSHGLGTLSAKQHEFLQFLIDRTRETGVWPTSREIIDHFGYGSSNRGISWRRATRSRKSRAFQ